MNNSTQKVFWKQFATKIWEKKPILKKNFASPLSTIDDQQIFSMLVAYSDQCRKLKDPSGFKLFVDGQRQYDEETLQILPVKKDKSLLGYHARIEKMFPDYCLVCDELLQVSQENANKLQQFADNLFDHVGFPNRFVEIGLYLGNYRKTPFGVHVDGCGVFSFPVVGEKTFRLWTPSFAKKNPALDRSLNYSKFNKHSQTLKATPDDMTYWPSKEWHIAESDGSFSATWSLGVWVDRTHQENIEHALSPLLKEKLGQLGQRKISDRPPISGNGQIQNLPESYSDSIKQLKAISENDLHDAFLKAWLQLASKKGFKNLATNKNLKKISFSSRIKIADSQNIFWAKLKASSKIIYAFNGYVTKPIASNRLLKLIKALNLGHSCLVQDYLVGPTKSEDLKTLQTLTAATTSVRKS